jgi:Protein of unknown function (DUF2924)
MPRVVIGPAPPDRASLDTEIARLRGLDVGQLRARWHTMFRRRASPHLTRHLLFRILAYRLQADRLGEQRPGVCSTESGQDLRTRQTGFWLISTDLGPS